MTPVISVIIPVYNAQDYLEESVRSILNQTFRDFELIAVNDGSTDSSLQVLETLANEDPRIKIVNNEYNSGIIASLNKAIALSRGEYIARMDADDIALPLRLEAQFDFMKKHPEAEIVGSWIELFENVSHKVEYPISFNDINLSMLFFNPIAHPSVMIKKSFFDRSAKQYSVIGAEDYALWSESTEFTQLLNIPQILLNYRISGKNYSFTHSAKMKDASINIIMQLLCKLGIRDKRAAELQYELGQNIHTHSTLTYLRHIIRVRQGNIHYPHYIQSSLDQLLVSKFMIVLDIRKKSKAYKACCILVVSIWFPHIRGKIWNKVRNKLKII